MLFLHSTEGIKKIHTNNIITNTKKYTKNESKIKGEVGHLGRREGKCV